MTHMTRRNFLSTAAATALSAAAQNKPKRPNILFAIADDWGYGHASAYGCKWINTPAFDRVAKEGVLFTHAFTSNPKCSPCRATILTGRNTWQLKEAINHYSIFPNDFATYPAELERAGYFVGMTGKGWGPGDFKSTGFEHNPAGVEYQEHKAATRPTDSINTNDYAKNFEAFLQRRPAGTPFCFWLGATEPHRPYDPGSGVRAGREPSRYPGSRLLARQSNCPRRYGRLCARSRMV